MTTTTNTSTITTNLIRTRMQQSRTMSHRNDCILKNRLLLLRSLFVTAVLAVALIAHVPVVLCSTTRSNRRTSFFDDQNNRRQWRSTSSLVTTTRHDHRYLQTDNTTTTTSSNSTLSTTTCLWTTDLTPTNNRTYNHVLVKPGTTLTAEEYFGVSVAVHGQHLITGAFADQTKGWDAGAAHIYRWNPINNTYVYDAFLTAADGTADDRFGFSVAIYDNTAVVGAHMDDGSTGSVYVFTRSSTTGQWTQSQKIRAGDKQFASQFGVHVAIHDNVMVVGADLYSANKTIIRSGAAYVFRRPNATAPFAQQARFIPADVEMEDNFGVSVAVHGNTVVVGSVGDNQNGLESGSAYVYDYDPATKQWSLAAKLLAADGRPDDGFGFSVDIHKDTVLIGAAWADHSNLKTETGAAYVFQRTTSVVSSNNATTTTTTTNTTTTSTWTQVAKLTATTPVTGALFGRAVSLTDGLAVIGAHMDEAAYVFRSTTVVDQQQQWINQDQQKFQAVPVVSGDNYAFAVAVDGTDIAVGSFLYTRDAVPTGAVYVYQCQERPLLTNNNTIAPTSSTMAPTTVVPEVPGRNSSSSSTPTTMDPTVSTSSTVAPVGSTTIDPTTTNGTMVPTIPTSTVSPMTNGTTMNLTTASPSTLAPLTNSTVTPTIATTTTLPPIVSNTTNGTAAPTFSSATIPPTPIIQTCFSNTSSKPLNQILKPGAPSEDYFGVSVGISGDYMIAGAFADQTKGWDAGAAFVYKRNTTSGTFVFDTKLVAADGAADDRFGFSVAIQNDTAVVSSHMDDGESGSVYIFTRAATGKWSQVQKLVASDKKPLANFGVHVAIDGNTIVVGAYMHDKNATLPKSGQAYVFRKNAATGKWAEEAKLLSSDIEPDDNFGVSVGVSQDTIVVGSVGDNQNGPESGSAYIFNHVGGGVWTQTAKLLASDGKADDGFGFSVDIYGDTVLVGAAWVDLTNVTGDSSDGAAYVFEKTSSSNTWSQVAKLTANTPLAMTEFGRAVSLGNGVAAISGHGDESAYMFTRSADGKWANHNQVRREAPTRVPGDFYGFSVDVDTAASMVVGSFLYTRGNPPLPTGAAYVYDPCSAIAPPTLPPTLSPTTLATTTVPASTMVPETATISPSTNTSTLVMRHEFQFFQPRVRANNSFGIDVAKSGNYTIIGAPGRKNGVAYIFHHNEKGFWFFEKMLKATTNTSVEFGKDVAIHGPFAVVGERGVRGCAVVFNMQSAGNWVEEAQLCAETVSDPTDIFVDIWNETVVFGVKNATNGIAHVYTRSLATRTWVEEGALLPSDADGKVDYPTSLAIDNNIVVLGSGGNQVESVYVFRRNNGGNWLEEDRLVATNGVKGDWFGASVDLDDSLIIVGASRHKQSTGAAYLYQRKTNVLSSASSWSLLAELSVNGGGLGDTFGRSVAISESMAVVGAPGNNASMYLFLSSGNYTNDQQIKIRYPSSRRQGSEFGSSVFIDRNEVVVGAHQHLRRTVRAGTAYLFDMNKAISGLKFFNTSGSFREFEVSDDDAGDDQDDDVASLSPASELNGGSDTDVVGSGKIATMSPAITANDDASDESPATLTDKQDLPSATIMTPIVMDTVDEENGATASNSDQLSASSKIELHPIAIFCTSLSMVVMVLL